MVVIRSCRIAAFVLLGMGGMSALSGATLHVGVSRIYKTIGEAVAAATSGDRIVVDIGVYFETIDYLDKELWITSTDPNDPDVVSQTIIDGLHQRRCVRVAGGQTTASRLSGLTLLRGMAAAADENGNGGGILCVQDSEGNPSSLEIRRCIIRQGRADNDGGGLFCDNSSPLLVDCEFHDNTAGANGGGIANAGGSPALSNVLLTGSQAQTGGGLWTGFSSAAPVLNLCTVTGNTAIGDGGGIAVVFDSAPSISNTIVYANNAQVGGADVFAPAALASFSHCDIGNSGGSSGWDFGLGTDLGGNIDADPNFRAGPFGGYYLAQVDAGQEVTSPCVDAGDDQVDVSSLGRVSTRTDEQPDDGILDIGFHLPVTADDDQDGIKNLLDNCPRNDNPGQEDFDDDGVGDLCDNCPELLNVDQVDADGDSHGDLCDICVDLADPNQVDADQDGVGDGCDNCPNQVNTDQADKDGNGVGDACDVQYEAVDLGTLGQRSKAFDLNASGAVVGESFNGSQLRGFVWEEGSSAGVVSNPQMSDLGAAIEIVGSSSARAINDANDIVGYAQFAGFSFSHGARWDAGSVSDLDTLQSEFSRAYDINTLGQAVGVYDLNGQDRASLWLEQAGLGFTAGMHDLGTLDNSSTTAWAINDVGQIIGESLVGGVAHAFRWESGSMTDLGTLGGQATRAYDLNNSGLTVGESRLNGFKRAVLWESGGLSNLGEQFAGDSAAYGINDLGDIVGVAEVSDADRAVLWERQADANYVGIDLNLRLIDTGPWSFLQEARAINEAGHIAGTGLISGVQHAFLFRQARGKLTLLVPEQYATIQAALDTALDGDTVQLAAGVYQGIGNTELDFKGKAVTLRGADTSDPNLSVIDGGGTSRCMVFQSGETSGTIVEGVLLRNGYHATQGGGIYCDDATPTIRHCRFESCRSDADGGAIALNNARASITDCTIEACQAGTSGGAVYAADSSDFTMTNTQLYGNTATDGGAIYLDASSPTISDCRFTDNQALTGRGGAIYQTNSSGAIVTATCFRSNRADEGGAMFLADSTGSLTTVEFLDNYAGTSGGAVMLAAGSAPSIEQSTFKDNSSDGQGGALFCQGATATLKQCIVRSNTAALEGGGLAMTGSTSSMSLDQCLIAENTTNDTGGGVFKQQGSLTVEFCTVVDNAAANVGGIESLQGAVSLSNSIIWNSSPQQLAVSGTGTQRHCNVGPVVGSSLDGKGNLSVDPNFLSATNYRLTIGSPCAEAGDPNLDVAGLMDLDDKPRSFELIDMGCYEQRRPLPAPSDAFATIQAAIDAALDGDIVEIAEGVHAGPGNRGLNPRGKAMTIRGVSGAADCVIDCNSLDVGLRITTSEGRDTVIEGLTIRNGKSDRGGGVFCQSSRPTIRQCVIIECMSDGGGGGVYCLESSPLLEACQFLGNQAGTHGGGVYAYRNSDPNMVDCLFLQNSGALRGGAVYADWNSGPTVQNSYVSANTAPTGPQLGLANPRFPTVLSVQGSNVAGGQADVFVDVNCRLLWGNNTIDAPADLDADNTVTISDLQLWLGMWLDDTSYSQADFNGDGRVTMGDFAEFVLDWPQTSP